MSKHPAAQWLDSWAKDFFEAPTTPMPEETSRAFIVCTMKEMKDDPNWPGEAVENSDPYRIFALRARAIGLKFTKPLAVFLVATYDSPGHLVMFAYALRAYQEKHELKVVGIDALANAFMWGFPTEEAFSTLWNAQKAKGMPLGNTLDSIVGDPYAN